MVTAGRAYADGLGKQGFFSNGAKVGILTYESPEFRHAIDRAVRPTLRGYGIGSPDVQYLTPPQALSDQGSLVSSIQNAVLKFRSNGVTHVMFLDGNSSITYFFLKQAKSQEYYPRYGFSSLSYPSFLQANAGADQLAGTVGVGWLPTQDVEFAFLPSNPARSLCEQIQNEAGNKPVAQTDLTFQLSICSTLFTLKHGLERAPGVTPSDFRTGVPPSGRRTSPPQPASSTAGRRPSPGGISSPSAEVRDFLLVLPVLRTCADRELMLVLSTSLGDIRIALFHQTAPATTQHIRSLIASHALGPGCFYRAQRLEHVVPGREFEVLQGGGPRIAHTLPSVEHEPTVPHTLGTVSLARLAPGTASSECFSARATRPQPSTRPHPHPWDTATASPSSGRLLPASTSPRRCTHSRPATKKEARCSAAKFCETRCPSMPSL